MNNIRTFTITIGKVYNGTEECKNPHVELAGKQHIAVNCIDPKGCKYSVQLGPNDIEPCLTFLVRCSDCDTCGTKVIKKCFCDSVDDCESCEICDADGFCSPTCPDGICTDGICYECNEEVNCTCNKVCKNGECTCPPGTKLNEHGCCDECQKDGDCDVCDTCTDHGAYNSCEPKECNCDATGKCGAKGACVECTNSGQCPPNEVCDSHCGCKCAPGYSRINGICTPTDCPNGDEDCGVCEICVGTHCIPTQCPSGKVPVEINGVCSCVEECNCDQPNCSSRFNFCGESSIPGKCGCQPCTGNCDTGCDDPCICDEHLNKCKFNPCFGSCESGLDCGPTCGCKDGECVPCDILGCDSDECARTLGCTCSAIGKCVKDACDSSPCSVAADCSLGCTCDGGVCSACSNFSCNNGDCSSHDGCICSGGECIGDPNPGCHDSITLTKDDAACTITGTLVKEKCCQCPAITLDVKTISAVDKGTTAKTVVYRAEVRKGAFDGISVDSNPLVDAFTNPFIAENEPPTAGTIRLNYSVSYKVFDIVNGKDVATGLSTISNKPSQQVTYVGGVSQKDFTIELPRIGVRTVSGTQALVVEFIELIFSLETKMVFPNTCEYASGTEIGKIKITSNDEFLKTPIGNTIKSDNCRLPFVKWTKFPLGSTTGNTFRKLYLPATEGNTYADTIDGPKGAESCFTYLFEPDCSCDDPAQQYIVFCNPVFNKPLLEDCGKKAKINIDAACTSNQVKDYELYVNGVVVKTFKLNTPQVFDWISITPITSIKLHMKCDSVAQCDTEYTYPENKIDPIPQGSCKADGTVTFTFDDASYPGGISSITFDGELKTSNFVFKGKNPNTDYSYQVTFSNGCVSSVKTTNWTCCVTPTIECSAGGKFKVNTGSSVGVKYNGVALPTNGIITPPTTGTSPLTYVCDGVTKTITIVPYADYKPCCNIVLSTYTVDAAAKTINVGIASTSTSGNYSVSVKKTTGAILSSATMTNNGVTNLFTITSSTDESLVFEVKNEDTFCVKTFPISFDKDGCDIGLVLSIDDDNCLLSASTKEKTCHCDSGKISGSISSVTALPNNKLSATLAITPVIANSAGKDVISSSLQIYVNGVISSTETLHTLTPSSIIRTIDAYCLNTSHDTVAFTAETILCDSNCGGNTHVLKVYVPNPYIVNGITIGSHTFSPTPHTDGDPWYIYYTPSGSTSIVISFTNTVSALTYQSNQINPTTIQSQSYTLDVSTSDCYLCGGTIKGADIKLVYGITLEDGCIYTGELSGRACVGSTTTLSEVALTNTNPTGRKMQFELFNGTTLLQTDYKKSPSSINYSANDIDFKPGQEYNVTASCNCEETATTSECFETVISKYEPTGYVWGSNCNKTYGITIESCYHGEKVNVNLGGSNQVVTLDSNGTGHAIFTLPAPITTATVPITYSYQINGSGTWCSNSKTLPNALVPEHTVSYNCTDGTNQQYTATISINGGGTVLITSKPSGGQYGTISGSSLVGVTTTDTFPVGISINGSCTYTVYLQHDCSCNVTNATVTSSTLNICVFNGVTSDQNINVSVTRIDNGNDWWTSLGSTVIGGSHTGSSAVLSITGAQLLAAAPNSGSNIVNLNITDASGGDICKSIPITINRTNIQYYVDPACSGGFWNVGIISSTAPITLSNNNAGTINGQNIINIPLNTTSVKFKVNKGSCTSDFVTVQIPTDCAPTCNNSEILISTHDIISPCSLTNTRGLIIINANTSNLNCPITRVEGTGQDGSYYSNGYWYVGYTSDAVGAKTITAYTDCGCSKQTIVNLVQDCCSGASEVSLSTSQNFCTTTGGAVSVSVFNPNGYTLSNWSISTGSWITGPSSTGGIVTVSSGQTQLNISVDVLDSLGNVCIHNLQATVPGVTCDTDLCTGVSCGPCQICQNGICIPDPSLQAQQGPCGVGNACCNGYCTADCVAGADSYTSGITYTHEVCGATDCGSPVPIQQACFTPVYATESVNCVSGVCMLNVSTQMTKESICSWSNNISDYVIEYDGHNYTASTINVVGNTNTITLSTPYIAGSCSNTDATLFYQGIGLLVFQFAHGNQCLDTCNPCLI